MANVSFFTKYLSNRYYITEIPVEGKRTIKFFCYIGYFDLYMAQVIRAGNCISLLSTSFELNRDNFWNTHYFEDLTRHIYWTFNKSFQLILTEKLETLSSSTISRCIELLNNHFVPYDNNDLEDSPDEELQWCLRKKSFLLNDAQFTKMFELDKHNRKEILEALRKRYHLLNKPADENKESILAEEYGIIKGADPTFLNTLNPIKGNPEETLQFIIQKTKEAGFDYNIFSRVERLPNGKNQYGLNGNISAAIDFFYQRGYFKEEFSLEQIFNAYSSFTGNTIGKLKVFISEFRHDNSYIKHTAKLKTLKINKLV